LQDVNCENAFLILCEHPKLAQLIPLFVKHGAIVNKIYTVVGGPNPCDDEAIPLNIAAQHDLRLVKYLLSSGADVKLKTSCLESALTSSLYQDKIDIANFLIFSKRIDFKTCLFYSNQIGDSIFIQNTLRQIVFDIDTREYREKWKLIRFLKRNGIDYSKAPIPQYFIDQYSKEFLETY
jgi:hypothetical protein